MSKESLEWFGKELQELRDSRKVNLHIYITQGDIEKAPQVESSDEKEPSSSDSSVLDPEKGFSSKEGPTPPCLPEIRRGRPDISAHIADLIAACDSSDHVGVGACGPSMMLDATRKALSHSTYDEGPSIKFHTEVSKDWLCGSKSRY
jgi:hypothetical protein